MYIFIHVQIPGLHPFVIHRVADALRLHGCVDVFADIVYNYILARMLSFVLAHMSFSKKDSLTNSTKPQTAIPWNHGMLISSNTYIYIDIHTPIHAVCTYTHIWYIYKRTREYITNSIQQVKNMYIQIDFKYNIIYLWRDREHFYIKHSLYDILFVYVALYCE